MVSVSSSSELQLGAEAVGELAAPDQGAGLGALQMLAGADDGPELRGIPVDRSD
mgnify:CR=1 FL=1